MAFSISNRRPVVFALPAIDTLSLMARRALFGLWSAVERRHNLHDLMLQAGRRESDGPVAGDN